MATAGLAELLGEVDALGGACDAARVSGHGRGHRPRRDQRRHVAAMTVTQWVRHHAPTTRAGGAGQVAALAAAFAKPANAAVKRGGVTTVRLPVRSAAAVVVEADRLRPLLAPGAEPHVLEGLIAMARRPRAARVPDGAPARCWPGTAATGSCRSSRTSAKRFVALSQPMEDGTGIVEYRLGLDPEGKAVLEAALGPLSAPRPIDG